MTMAPRAAAARDDAGLAIGTFVGAAVCVVHVAPGTGTITKRLAAPSEVECRICGNFAYLKDRVCPRCAKFLAIPGVEEWIEEVTECSFRRGQENIQEALNS